MRLAAAAARPFAVLALAAAAPLAGCGDEGDDAGRSATVEPGAPVRIAGDEYSFDPEAIRTSAGRSPGVRIVLRNGGALAHNVRVFSGERDLGGTPTFQGGETRSARVALGPGRYRLVCTVGDHAELGMVGTLEVGR